MPGHHVASIDPNAHVERRHAKTLVVLIDVQHGHLHLDGAGQRTFQIVLVRLRSAKQSHDGVPHELVDGAAMANDDFAHALEITVKGLHHLQRRVLLGHRREAAQVRQQNSDRAAFGALHGVHRSKDQPADFLPQLRLAGCIKARCGLLVEQGQQLLGELRLIVLLHGLGGPAEKPPRIAG